MKGALLLSANHESPAKNFTCCLGSFLSGIKASLQSNNELYIGLQRRRKL